MPEGEPPACDFAMVTVQPKEPFLLWARNVFDEIGSWEDAERDLKDDRNAYVIPSYDDDKELDRILKVRCRDIFANELFEWCTDESRWPSRRDYGIFKKWFHVTAHSCVFDLRGE